MLRSTVFAVALLVSSRRAVAAPPRGLRADVTFGAFSVTVAPDPDTTLSAAEYQITVRNEELLLARLSAPYNGVLSKSFVADLNHDGAFEVVVTYTEAATHATVIKVYSWKDDLLQPVKLAELDEQQKAGLSRRRRSGGHGWQAAAPVPGLRGTERRVGRDPPHAQAALLVSTAVVG